MTSKRKSGRITAELREKAVRSVQSGEYTAAQLARVLGLSERSVQRWVADAEQDASPLSRAERAELRRLRQENAELKQGIDILKNFDAFAARHKK